MLSIMERAGNWNLDDVMVDEAIRMYVAAGPIPEPARFPLYPVDPNPFNPGTTISFATPGNGTVRFVVFNAIGQRVARLFTGELAFGHHQIIWNGQDDRRRAVPPECISSGDRGQKHLTKQEGFF